MGKHNINSVVVRSDSHIKDDRPEDQRPMAARIVRRGKSGKLVTRMSSVHVVQVWTQVPHPRYGDRVPHFVPSYLSCVSDHRTTKECYVRRGVRSKR